MDILSGIAVVSLIVLLFFWCFPNKQSKPIQHACEKQPNKLCPHVVHVTDRGISTSGHFQCCKVRDQIKNMNETFCNMKPGVSYNGMIISKEFHENALRNKPKYKKLDSSGPH